MSLFERAKQVGLAHIKAWLPDGREDGGEWTALNPTRDDKTAGSFKVNLATGAWIDNATDEAGRDSVSLYAYLYQSKCMGRSQQKGYANVAGGAQAEAARCILEDYDPTYFPGAGDDFTPAKKELAKGAYWDGWSIVTHRVDPLPELDTTFYEKKWGRPIERWIFTDGGKAEKTILIVVRFVDGAKKEDRPFTLWTKAGEYRWRSKAPERNPLWNLKELKERATDAVVLCEGQKSASRGKKAIDAFVFTGWYGGALSTKKTDWAPLRGRTVYFWPDADNPGRIAIKALREIATEFDIKLSVVHPPVGVPKGWDLADAITEGRDVAQILEGEKEKPSETFLDDLPLPFDIMGTSGSDIIFYPHGSNHIERFRSSSLTKNMLLVLADQKVWKTYYPTENGIAWDAAINDIIRRAEISPVFDFTRVRGAGAWLDNGDILINTGEYLIVNGERKELHERVGDYVYEKRSFVPYRAHDPLSVEQASRLLDIVRHIKWNSSIAANALAGWLLLAPWGGVLRWRPHIWIVGPRGTGKSWVLETIVNPLAVADFGEKGDGTSTPAGVRQRLQNSSRPFVGDEMESDNAKFSEYIDQTLKLFRGSSSGTEGGSTLHGTADGEGQQWIMQSMACFASIGAAIRHGADLDRFTVIELSPARRQGIEQRKSEFAKLKDMVAVLNSEWSRAFHARTYSIIEEVLRCIDIMCAQASKLCGSMRDGDQIGTLMAGAWMVEHDSAPTAAQAYEYLSAMDINSLRQESDEKTDEEQCLDEILSTKIEVSNSSGRARMTVGSALAFWFEQEQKSMTQSGSTEFPAITQESVRRELEQWGIKAHVHEKQEQIKIAIAHPAIRKALGQTGWANTYSEMLKRLDNFIGVQGPERFGGIPKRFIKIKAENITENVPF